MSLGRVIKGVGGIYTVLDLDTKEYVTLGLRGKLRYMVVDKNSTFNKQITHKTKLETKTIKISPKVGDYVLYSDNIITEIKPRINDLIRPSIANVDQVLLLFAAKKPDFQLNLLDQFLVLMEEENVKAKIIITKIDLLTEEELINLKEVLSYYEKIGYEVFFVNSKTKEGFESILPIFKDKISVLSGQTGAGKSTFINSLIPGFNLQTQEISEALGRGKHTTTATELYEFEGGFIGDTPGFSKLDFSIMEATQIKDYFIEFSKYECKFRGCLHDKEPGCAIKEAVSSGQVLKDRYDNYLKFLNTIRQTIKKY